MALSIKDRETEQLARKLAERLKRTGSSGHKAALLKDLEAIRSRVAALPTLDDRSSDEIIGYDENGIPS